MTELSGYTALGYGGDFGLTGLTETLSAGGRRPDLADALAAAVEQADQSEGEEAVELGEDARRLLVPALPDAVLRTVWLAAVGRAFDPADHGIDTRAWLEKLSALATDRLRQNKRSYAAPRIQPVRDEELSRSIGGEVRALARILDQASGLPGLAHALEEVVTHADADLGMRFFLRALKAYSVPIDQPRADRFVALGDHFGYHVAVVYEGLHVMWPPIDTTRRDPTWDFGLSMLAARFGAGLYNHGVSQTVREVAAADAYDQTPGSAAAQLLQDVKRLLDSGLSAETLAIVWLAAVDSGYDIDRFGTDGRDWLQQIVEVCEERLRDVAPTYRPSVPAARTDLIEMVMHEVLAVEPLAAHKAVSPTWHPIAGTAVMAALKQVVTRVDPDLGFRLFLRAMWALRMPLTEDQYTRYETLRRTFDYSEDYLMQIEQLVRRD
ncbi:hypothetical protein [Streptomyces sp. NPDC054952]